MRVNILKDKFDRLLRLLNLSSLNKSNAILSNSAILNNVDANALIHQDTFTPNDKCADKYHHPLYDLLWQDIYKHYTQPHRHYHTLTHLDTMFAYFEQYQHKLYDPCAVALAIWYHDIVYDTAGYDTVDTDSNNSAELKTKSNEKQSADYFTHIFADSIEETLITRVVQLIHCTQTHMLPDGSSKQNPSADLIPNITPNPSFNNQNTLNDIAYFLDMDLAILGADWATYQQYANAVRLEYKHVPLSDYQLGRRQILQNFLQRERLYFSDDFFERFEKQARDNIQQEIKLLVG